MKLIMENWKRFLNEERQRPPVDPRLLPALAQDAMEVVAANPGMDAASITLATMAEAGSELPLIDMESVAAITLGDLFDEAGLQDIMQGATEFAADAAWEEEVGPQGYEIALEERGLGLGEPRDTPPGDEDPDRHYDNERPPPKSWVDGKPPKPPVKKIKESSLPTWAQQLILQHPRSSAKIENYARAGYDRGEVIRHLNLGYRSGATGNKDQGRGGY